MSPIIAPWLETKPSDFVNAAREGAATGLSSRSERDDTAAKFAQIAQEGARMQQAQQQFQIQAQHTAMALQLQKQSSDRQFELEKARQAATLELGRQRLDILGQSASKKWQQQGDYQAAVKQFMASNPNATPQEAAAHASAATGYDPGIITGAIRSDATTGAAQIRADNQPDKEGNGMKEYYSLLSKEATGEVPAGSAAKYKAAMDGTSSSAAPAPDQDGTFTINGKKMKVLSVTPSATDNAPTQKLNSDLTQAPTSAVQLPADLTGEEPDIQDSIRLLGLSGD